MIVDCHMHVNWLGYTADKVAGHFDAIGVDKGWLLTWEAVNGSGWERTVACPPTPR